MWRHVPRVAAGLTVQGGLELVAAVAILLGAADSDAQPPASFYDFVLLRVAPWCLLPAGALKALAGRRNRAFRGRALGLVALWSAVPSAVVWACAPSGLALLAFGLIVYRQPSAREAFALGESGKTPAEVGALLGPLQSD